MVPYVLPLLAAVFYFDTFRTADGFPPVWTVRASVIGDHMLFEFLRVRRRHGRLGGLAGTPPQSPRPGCEHPSRGVARG